jgi:DNA-binding NarL/FixJ family response regulator
MDGFRCVIANMPQQMLVDIVENMAEESGVIEIVERVKNISEIPSAIANNAVDLLILGMKGNDLSEPCISLMNQAPDLPIVGLVDDGRRLAVYLNNVGKNDILQIIRTIGRNGGK